MLLLGGLATVAVPAGSHDFGLTRTLVLLKPNGSYQIDITCDLDALLLGVGSGHAPGALVERIATLPEAERSRRIERLRGYFERRVRPRFDGERAAFLVTFPDPGELGEAPPAAPSHLGTTARLTGRAPAEATAFTFWASRSFSAVELTVVVVERDRVERQLLGVGEESAPVLLEVEAAGVASASLFLDYLGLGFTHILPYGYDHLLFVLGLYLLGAGWRPLLLQVTAFTVAHTLTLALASYGVLTLPAALVEPLIALSITWVAVENLWAKEVRAWRVGVVFGFGLLHGLGFAGVLAELGMPESRALWALLGFNLGVELAQVAALALAFSILGWWRDRSWYRRRVAVPLSLAIAAAGALLAVERLVG